MSTWLRRGKSGRSALFSPNQDHNKKKSLFRPDDPTRFKANPDMLSSKLGDDEDESEDDEDEEEGEGVKKAGQKYVAPKNVPKHFDEDKSKEEIQVMGFSVNF